MKNLVDYVNACFTGLWIETVEPTEAQREIARTAEEQNWRIHVWDFARGELGTGQGGGDPRYPLSILNNVAFTTDETTIIIMHNYHLFLNSPMVLQDAINRIIEGKAKRTFLVVLSPTSRIPLELEKLFVVIQHDLPTKDDLDAIAKDIQEDIHTTPELLAAASGLTRYEAEGAFALSLARKGDLHKEELWELKSQMLKKSGALEMHRGKEMFDDLGGLDALKSFCVRALTPKKSDSPRPKGILLLGPPGTGKSAFAKALGNQTGRPTVLLDMGSLYGSLVGQSEERIRQALRTVDAMSPCILFVDEIEKALAGASSEHQGDSGVSSRLFGSLLTWLNDHTSDVFFIGTCNNIKQLPPEFSRAERFDGIFFIDFPTAQERDMIWTLYEKHYKLPVDTRPDDDQWTGAEIRSCCRLAALLDITISEAAKNVVPVHITAQDKVSSLREWASGRCLSAANPGIYFHNPITNNTTAKRRVLKKEALCG